MNRVDRLVAIIIFLQSRRLVRAKDVAEHFEISMRTVYRDVKALCEAGVPIAAEAGEGYSMVEGYHLPPIMFTPEETSALFLGTRFVERSVLPEETLEYLEKLHDATEIFYRNSKPQEGFRDDVIVTIQDAIANRNVLKMEYFSPRYEDTTMREIEPLGMLHYSQQWHLIAFCRLRQDFRDFRTDRIKNIFLEDEVYPERKDFVLKEYIEKCFSQPHGDYKAKIKFSSQLAHFIRERYAYGLVGEECVEDGVIMEFMIPNVKWMSGWLLSFGTQVEVLSPESLRQELIEQTKTLLSHHQK